MFEKGEDKFFYLTFHSLLPRRAVWLCGAIEMLVIFALGIVIGSCHSDFSDSQDSSAHEVEGPAVEIMSSEGPVLVRVEVPGTAAQKERGLMYREHLEDDAGMLFISDYERVQRFWMKNTFIPLDLIFIGTDMEIKGIIEKAMPESLEILSIRTPVKYVLEVNGGFCKRHGVMKGQRVRLILDDGKEY
jgi:uncharacterized membrane protein (UPF0127 family)